MSNWKFIEYSLYKSKDTYYSLRKILSYNLPINIIIGARGFGKTFAVKRHVLLDYMKNPSHNFVWVRDNVDDIKKLTEGDGRKFVEDIHLMEVSAIQDIKMSGSFVYMNGDICGDVLPVSVYQRYKGSSYQHCYNLVYDEFIPEKGRIKRATVNGMINTLSTVFRTRNEGRAFFTANALDRGDPFLEFLGVTLKEFGFYVNKEMGVVLHYADNSEKFVEKNSQGIVGRLILNSPSQRFKENIMDGKFVNDDDTLIFDKLPSKSTLRFIIETPCQRARFYYSKGKLYVTPDYNDDMYLDKRYVANLEDVSFLKPVLPGYIRKKIKEYLETNNVAYQSSFLKRFVLDVI